MMFRSALAGLALLVAAKATAESREPIRFVHEPPRSVAERQALILGGTLSGAADVEHASLYYRSAATRTWRSVDLELVAGSEYRAHIAAAHVVPPSLEYYVVAFDFLRARHAALGSEDAPVKLAVVRQLLPSPDAASEQDATDASAAPTRAPITPRIPIGVAPAPGEPFAAPPLPASTATALAAPQPAATPSQSVAARVAAAPSEPAPRPNARAALRDDGPAGKTDVLRAASAGAERAAAEVPFTFGRIDSAGIAALGARTLVDVLQALPELDVRTDVGGFVHASWRGRGEDADLPLVVDGQTVNNPYDARAMWRLPASALTLVELVRESTAELPYVLGLGGAIVITTDARAEAHTTLAAGAYTSRPALGGKRRGSYLADGRGGITLGDWLVGGFVGVDASDGSQQAIATDAYASAGAPSDAPGVIRDDRLGLAAGASAKANALLGGTAILNASTFYETGGGNIGLLDTFGPRSSMGWHSTVVSLAHELAANDDLRVSTRLAANLQTLDTLYQLTPAQFALADRNGDGAAETFPIGVLEERSTTGANATAQLRADWLVTRDVRLQGSVFATHTRLFDRWLGRNITTLGVSQPFDALGEPPLLISDLAMSVLGVQLCEEWRITGPLSLAGGVRFAYATGFSDVALVRTISPSLALTAKLRRLELRLAYSGGARPPTLAERTDQTGATLPAVLGAGRIDGNPHLTSPAAHNLEASARFSAAAGSWRYDVEARTFAAYLLDTIVALPQTGSGDTLVNRSRVEQVGGALSGRVTLDSRARTAHSFIELSAFMHRTSDLEDGGHTALTSTPQHGALLLLALALGPWADATLLGRYESARRNDTRTALEASRAFAIPAQVTLDATLRSLPFWDTVRVGLRLHNALDAARRDPVPRPDLMPAMVPREGLQVLATVEIEH